MHACTDDGSVICMDNSIFVRTGDNFVVRTDGGSNARTNDGCVVSTDDGFIVRRTIASSSVRAMEATIRTRIAIGAAQSFHNIKGIAKTQSEIQNKNAAHLHSPCEMA